jgi:hypothetical protein
MNKKIVALMLPLTFLLLWVSRNESFETIQVTSPNTVSTCTFLKESLLNDAKIIDALNKATEESNAQAAKDDPALAEALMDDPSLNIGLMYGDNWDQHARRMIGMYSKASNMVADDYKFSSILKDSELVWTKRLILHTTQNGPGKLDLDMEVVKLDTRENNINRPYLREKCGISEFYLP